MDQTTKEIRTEQWRQIVLEANGTSLTKKEFCRQNGIKEKQFYYWQRKIRRQDAARFLEEASLAQAKTSPVVSSCSSSSSFVALELSTPEEFPQESSSLTSIFQPELMLQLNGVQLFVGETVHEATLQSVIRVLRNA